MRVRKELIPLVCLLIISVVSSSGIRETDGEISVNSSSPVPRYIRDANGDKMSVAVDRMQKIARLTTGISVQIGLISGSIQPDPLISELLRFGNVTLSDILALNAEKLTGAMKQIRELPNTLVASEGIEQIEAKMDKIEQVRKLVKKAGDVKTWVGKQAFLQDVEFVTKNIDLKVINLVNTEIGELRNKKKMILAIDKSNPKQLTNFNFLIEELAKDIEVIEKTSAELARSDGRNWKYPKESAVESLEPLKSITEAVAKAHEYLDAMEKTFGSEKKELDTSKKNIEVLSKLSSSLDKVVPDLKRVEAVVRSRGSSQNKALEYPGFMNGFRDIDNLFDDLSVDWMAQVIRADSMAVSLKPLKSLFPLFVQIDQSFGKYQRGKTNTFSNFVKHVEKIRAHPSDSKAITGAVDEFWKCKTLFTGLDQPSDADLRLFIDLVKELDGNMRKLQSRIDNCKEILNSEETVKLLDEVKKLCITSDDASKLPILVDTFNKSVAMKTLEMVLQNATTVISDVDTFAREARASAVKIINNAQKVDTYISSLQKYLPLFECLHELDDQKSTLVMEGMKTSQKFRNGPNDKQMVDDGEEVIDRVVSNIERFKELKEAIGNMKHEKVKNLDALKALSDPVKQSKVIGAAVRGVTAMKEALRKKVHADAIILNSEVVETQMKQAKLEQADVNNLKSVIKMNGSLTTMYQKLDVWRKGVSEVSSKGLANSFSMFSTAKSVPGVTGDLGAMAKSVDVLIKSVTDNTAAKKLVSVKKALETLDTSGLDFASYSTQFDASRDSLTALDVFCANYTTRITPESRIDYLDCPWGSKCICEECDVDTHLTLSIIVSIVMIIIYIGTWLTIGNWRSIVKFSGKMRTKLKNKNKKKKKGKKASEEKSAEQKTKTKSGDSGSKMKSSVIVV